MTVKTPFPYPGGKSQYAKRIIELLPQHYCYVEPFGGAGSVLMQKPESTVEVYNDLNSDVVTFYRVLRDREDDLIEYLDATPYSYEVHQDILQRWYGQETRPDDDVQQAAEFFYLRIANYGSIFDRSGFSSYPYGDAAGNLRRKTDDLREVRDRYGGVTLENRDWSVVVEKYDSADTVFYMDPPYIHIEASGMYGGGDPTDFDHKQFCGSLHDLEGKWVVSYSDVPDELSDYRVLQWDQNWKMARGRTDDEEATESLILNFDPSETPGHGHTKSAAEW